MNQYIFQYVKMCDPFATEEDVLELKELNEWDLLITFKDGRKIIYDRFTNYHKNVYYENIHELTEEQEKKEFAYRLRSLMGRKFISQEDLANLVGTSQTMISHYMTGRSIPNLIMGRKIAKALGCSIDDFFDRDY